MKPRPRFELELGGIGSSTFNLASEATADGEHLLLEARQAEIDRRAAAEYQRQMQRTLAECPGFVGGELPAGPGCAGSILIEPECARSALDWLKRRVSVDDAAEIETTGELRVQIWTWRKGVRGRRVSVKFGKPEQFTLNI